MTDTTPFPAPESIINSPSPAGELDLVSEVYQLLCRATLREAAERYFLQDTLIRQAQGKHFSFQRVNLNKFWTLQLLQLETTQQVNTRRARLALIDTGSTNEWIRLFEAVVLPLAINFELPLSIREEDAPDVATSPD